MEVTATSGNTPKTSTSSKTLVDRQTRGASALATLEGLALRSWVPVRSLALRAQALWPFFPAALLTMSDDRIDVAVELPGVDAADVDLSVDNRALVIRGVKRMHREINTKNCDRTERYHVSFERSLRVAGPIDREAVGARLKNGVLQVRLPFASNGVGISQRSKIPVATA